MGINDDAERIKAVRSMGPSDQEIRRAAGIVAANLDRSEVDRLLRRYLEYVQGNNIPPTRREGLFRQKRRWALFSGTGDPGSGKSGGQVYADVCSDGTVRAWNIKSAEVRSAIVAKVAEYGYKWPYDD